MEVRDLSKINWAKVGVMFLAMGALAYGFYWVAHEMRTEVTRELSGKKPND